MTYVLVTVSGGIVEDVRFFRDAAPALEALSAYVKDMNPESDDAALYGPDGMVANAKCFLDDDDQYIRNDTLVEELSKRKQQSLHLIANPTHPLGFMVASPDDPIGYVNPVEALSDLGQMRQDHGNLFNLYRVVPVHGPIAARKDLETYNQELEVENFDYSLIAEFLS